MHNSTIRKEAVDLRKEGYSYNYISEKIGISKGTLHCWLGKIPYSPNIETITKIGKARAVSGLLKHKEKLASFLYAKVLAEKDVGEITKRDLFMLGLGIYIGEGTKDGNTVRIVNANYKIIKLTIRWLKEVCGLKTDNFVIRLHIYPDNNIAECVEYWSKQTGIPTNQFLKTQVDIRKNKKVFKKGKLPYGTAHMTVKGNGKKEFGVLLARRIGAWIDRVLC